MIRTVCSTTLFLFVFINIAWSCMPGYGRERMKLKEYLGIEWVRNGLEKSAQNDNKPVRHASDLDCQFDNPAECRWRNVKPSEMLDTLDFYLFEKTDFTEFPILQVRPGPSKLNEGDKLIFTGDRKREDQSAIWLSSPIACQNTTGQLTFTFWLYNGARVEVILLERKNGQLRILPEKPFVDCGTVPLNTDCTADIAPRDTPFSIGIRAYDISNYEGSFVMIDNIVYRATLCRLSIDLGESFRGKPLITNMAIKEIDSSDELNCTEFDKNCRWRSVGYGREV
uniref:MAM domain-containing protein n=1 Tax=Parascaris univalens TaxID=6257 RepID=A0A915BIJ9_PARUN